MNRKEKNKSKSLGLAFYFGVVVALIIVASLVFKSVDLVASSKFDGTNTLTVLATDGQEIHLISVSPKDGTLSRLSVNGTKSVKAVEQDSLPLNSILSSSFSLDPENISPKSEFRKILFNLRKVKTDLTIIDLVRLSIFSSGVSDENVTDEKAAIGTSDFEADASTLFKDPQLAGEKQTIEVTNTTSTGGLGNKVAKFVTNLGGQVILVNTSSKKEEKSVIESAEESYTVKKLSKSFGIPFKKVSNTPLADVIIVIGEDRKELFQ